MPNNDNQATLPQQIAFLTDAVIKMTEDYSASSDQQRRALRFLIKDTLKKIERLKRKTAVH